MASRRPSLGIVARAIGRVCYAEALTVAWSSVLFVLGSLPVLTIGASLLALTETWLTIVDAESEGRNVTERERFGVFARTWRESLFGGIPYSLALALVVAGSLVYFVLGSAGRSGLLLVWTLVGLYLVVIVLGWEFRAASVRMRSPAAERPGFREAMERAAYSVLDSPGYSVLALAWFASVLFSLTVFPPAFVALGPAVLCVTETVGFEELFGDGAETIRAAYAR